MRFIISAVSAAILFNSISANALSPSEEFQQVGMAYLMCVEQQQCDSHGQPKVCHWQCYMQARASVPDSSQEEAQMRMWLQQQAEQQMEEQQRRMVMMLMLVLMQRGQEDADPVVQPAASTPAPDTDGIHGNANTSDDDPNT